MREEIEAGRFREDLFYRLNVIPLELSPLRERKDDIPLLIEHFLEKYAESVEKTLEGVEADAKRILVNYSYPGNVRELENIIERSVALEDGEMISAEVLPYHMHEEPFDQVTRDIEIPGEGLDLEAMVERLEKRLIEKALERTGGVKKEAADQLDISFRSLRYRLDKYDID